MTKDLKIYLEAHEKKEAYKIYNKAINESDYYKVTPKEYLALLDKNLITTNLLDDVLYSLGVRILHYKVYSYKLKMFKGKNAVIYRKKLFQRMGVLEVCKKGIIETLGYRCEKVSLSEPRKYCDIKGYFTGAVKENFGEISLLKLRSINYRLDYLLRPKFCKRVYSLIKDKKITTESFIFEDDVHLCLDIKERSFHDIYNR